MKLKVIERIMLMGALPAENNFVTLKILRKLHMDLGFTEKEIKDFKMTADGNTTRWDATAEPAEGVEIEIGEKAVDIIVEALKKMDEQKKLTAQHLSLCEKFLEKKQEE